MAFEKARGVVRPDDKMTCLLSVSVTHDGLHRVVKDYLGEVYAGTEPFHHLNIHLFSEIDSKRILDDIILPGAEKYFAISDGDPIRRVFGVDGEYGRHYSFLKAISAFWQVLVDPVVKGSFKLDMDQVFDEEALIAGDRTVCIGTFCYAAVGGRRDRDGGEGRRVGDDGRGPRQ